MEAIFAISNRLVNETSMDILRSAHEEIRWNNRLISITGARGTGKTTLMLQHIRKANRDNIKSLYASLDNIWFSKNSLTEMADYFYSYGGTHLYLDEVHRYPNWAIEIKNIYDSYPGLHIVFTGSSLLEIYKSNADLSRRAVNYTIRELSFREFLLFEKRTAFPSTTLNDILKHHAEISGEITSKEKILPLFNEYLKAGCYPFYKEDIETYYLKIQNTITVILENDLPAIEKVEYATIGKIKKLLMILAGMVPYSPNISSLSHDIETNRANTIRYLDWLNKAQLLTLLTDKSRSMGAMNKPGKIYLNNPNLLYALNTSPNIGSIRETFFAHQAGTIAKINSSKTGDFLLNEKYIVEVGGKGEKYDQIKGIESSFVVADGIETGFGNKIPLWLFGFLY